MTITEALARLLDAMVPRRCAGCGREAADVLCETCVELILGSPLPPSRQLGGLTCHAALSYGPPVSSVLHRAKYRGCQRAMHLLAALAAERLAPRVRGLPQPGVVVPVPLGRRRQRGRGYNQAEVAARTLRADLAPGSELSPWLRRLRETDAQVGRRRRDRLDNLRAGFAWEGPSLTGRRVWLVDDVVTTGATLRAAGEALQQAGASRIEAVAVAATPG